MKEDEKIIKSARKEMRPMLESVLDYNSSFSLDKEQELLLQKILFAMSIIDRRFFYKGEEAYTDYALPIGEGQTISQPSTVARMLILARLREGDNVLEVGTGSGWNASLIAFLVYPGSVVSVERINILKERAENNLSSLKNHLKQKYPQDVQKLSKINFYAENIFVSGRAWKKRYDKIIITAGIGVGREEKVELLARKLLKQKGLLICPYRSGPLVIYEKEKKGQLMRKETKESYVFVPLLE